MMSLDRSISKWRLWLAGAMVAGVAWMMPCIALATTWTITNYGDDPGDTTTLRGALNAAHDGDTIDLTGLTGAIVLTHSNVQVLNMLGVNASITIVGPGPDKLAIDGNGVSPVFEIFTGITAMISGVTIRNGVGLTETIQENGEQLSVGFGGGIRNSGTLTLTDCAVAGNTAYGGGAGILNLPGHDLTIESCSLANNTAYGISGFAGRGGAILNSPPELGVPDVAGTLTVSESEITSNQAEEEGGGIHSDDGALTVSDTTLSNNTAGLTGSAISVNKGTVNLSNVTVSGNSVTGFSGGFGVAAFSTSGATSTITVTSSTFSANVSDAIVNGGTMTVTNSTIWGNAGSGITNQGDMDLVNATISTNQGKGLLSEASAYVKSTILAHNQSGNCQNLDPTTIVSQDHNISDDTTCAIFLIKDNDFAPHTDPGLDSGLKDNGGPTQTLALLPGSVAVDAIAPADCAVATDQRGVSRPQGKGCDIGAYEATPNFFITPIGVLHLSTDGSLMSGVQVNSFVGFSAPVTLIATGVPTGLSVSFSPNPVTPPSYGSVTSTATVTISPALTPGSYSFSLGSSSGTFSRSDSVTVKVNATTASVAQVTNAALAGGCIDSAGVANAITTKLSQAQADIDAGDIADARIVLNDLTDLLQAQRGKHIHTSCTINGVTFDPAAALIADTQALLANL